MKKIIPAVLVMVGIMFQTMPVSGQQVIIRPMTPREKYHENQRIRQNELGDLGRDINKLENDATNFLFDSMGIGPLSPGKSPQRSKSRVNKNQTAAKSNKKQLQEHEAKARQLILETHVKMYQNLITRLKNKDYVYLNKWWSLSEKKDMSAIACVYAADMFRTALNEVGIDGDSNWQKFMTDMTIRTTKIRAAKEEKILDKAAYKKTMTEVMSTIAAQKEEEKPIEKKVNYQLPANEVI